MSSRRDRGPPAERQDERRHLMSGTRVLVAGASIAGPALAHWLRRRGAEVTVVERAPGLRPGGQAVDARGVDRKSTRLNSRHSSISYAVFCLKKKNRRQL